MTLTPPRSGDLAARCRAQRLLDKKIIWRTKRRSMERRKCAGQKTGRVPESRRRIRLRDARRPVPVMVRCEGQAPRQARAGVAAIRSQPVRDRCPFRRPERTPMPFRAECPYRASCRSPSPTGQANEIAPDVCRWFVRSSPRAVSRVWWSSGKGGFYGGVTGLSERRPNLWGCVWLSGVAGLLHRHSGCRAGQRGDAGASPARSSVKQLQSGVAVALLFDERADELGDFVLLMTRKLAGLFKNLPQLARRAFAARLRSITAKEMFDRDIEQAGQLFNLFRAQRDGITLPNAVGGLCDPYLVGELRLRQARRFAGGVQARAERRARFFGRSACLHERSIPRWIFR